MPTRVLHRITAINKELLLLLSMFLIAGLLNLLADARSMVLGFFTLPTVAAAALFGRRQATLAAYGSVLIAVLVTALPSARTGAWLFREPLQLAHLVAWGGLLIVTGYTMGTVCDRQHARVHELRTTHDGAMTLLRHFIAKDEFAALHSARVTDYAARIGARLGFTDAQLDEIRRSDEIPLEARIFAVAEAYDALTSDQPYRKAMSPAAAKTLIQQGAGADFDPRVVAAFLTALRLGELDVRPARVAA
jgi:hypothetical protein